MTAELRVRQILYVAPTRQEDGRIPAAHTGTEILAQKGLGFRILSIKMLTTMKLFAVTVTTLLAEEEFKSMKTTVQIVPIR